jgi:hypothetical protein
VPWKPKLVDPPAGTEPLYDWFRTCTVPVLPDATPFQMFVIERPEGRTTVTRHPLSDEPPAVTVTLDTNPAPQSLCTE